MDTHLEFANYAARLQLFIARPASRKFLVTDAVNEGDFNRFAGELFALQFRHNSVFRKFCLARGVTPASVAEWREIPCVPTAAFKKFEVTCWSAAERTTVFHSSGTTEQAPSRHFHNALSLALYEASLRPWFAAHLLAPGARDLDVATPSTAAQKLSFLALTPPGALAPHSSLVHMFETVRREFGAAAWAFAGEVAADGSWRVNARIAVEEFQRACATQQPLVLLATAFSLVHLLDFLAEANSRLRLPSGSRLLETGGYKGRARELPKAELHALIAERLGVPASHIVCEYGMSELSSQAYDRVAGAADGQRFFRFPPWARVRVVSPETGREVAEGEAGLVQVFDLANLASALAIQTEDLAARRGECFELLGRASLAEPRGCSRMQSG